MTEPSPEMWRVTLGAGRDRAHRAEGAGEDDLAGAQRLAELAGRAGEPHQRVERVAEAGGAVAGGDLLAVDGHRHRRPRAGSNSSRVRRCRCRARTAPAGGVVGDGVAEADVPAGDPAVARSRARRRRSRPRRGPGPRRAGRRRGPAEHEGDLGLDPRLQQPRRRAPVAVGVGHVVEEDAEVGLVDAQLLLHRRRGEADLAADDHGAGCQPVPRRCRCCTA